MDELHSYQTQALSPRRGLALEVRETAGDLRSVPPVAHLRDVAMLDIGDTFPIRPSWVGDADCSGRTDLFFPDQFERPNARLIRENRAREICQGCPLVVPCRNFARSHREYGVWGGENEEERVQAGSRLNAPIGIRRRRTAGRQH